MNGEVDWKIDAFYLDSCNCDWGCPCQFMAAPTHGNCEGLGGIRIRKGNYGDVSLDGLAMALILAYPGPVHEGHGKASYYIDERATEPQFQALSNILTGAVTGGPFEVYASTCESFQAPRRARIRFTDNGMASHIEIENVGEVQLEPIKNPVTGATHEAIIELPTGFEASRMEQGSSKILRVADGYLDFNHSGTYGSISHVVWSGRSR